MRATVFVVGVLSDLAIDYARSEESVLSSRPCFRTMYVCMNTTNSFLVIGCFVDTSTTLSPCGPGGFALAEKETRKKRNVTRKNTASSKHYYFLEYLTFFVKNQPTKKNKN